MAHDRLRRRPLPSWPAASGSRAAVLAPVVYAAIASVYFFPVPGDRYVMPYKRLFPPGVPGGAFRHRRGLEALGFEPLCEDEAAVLYRVY